MNRDILIDQQPDTLHTIPYKLIKNAVASKKAGRDVYTASVLIKETCGTREIADRMVQEGCAVKASTIRLVLSEFADLVSKLASEGRAVNIGGVVRFMPTICGTFDSPDAPWDPQKHTIAVRACSAKKMRQSMTETSATREG